MALSRALKKVCHEFFRTGARSPHAPIRAGSRLRKRHAGAGAGDSRRADRPRPAGVLAHRQRQDRGLPAALDPAPAGRAESEEHRPARAGAHPDARTGAAGGKVRHEIRPGVAPLPHRLSGRRRALRFAVETPVDPGRRGGGDAGPPHRPSGARQDRLLAPGSAGAGRGRPHARHGLRRRHPRHRRALPGRAPDPAVLRHARWRGRQSRARTDARRPAHRDRGRAEAGSEDRTAPAVRRQHGPQDAAARCAAARRRADPGHRLRRHQEERRGNFRFAV